MKEYNTKITHCHGIDDVIYKIGSTAEKLISKCETDEERAFLLGHVNMAASLLEGLQDDKKDLSRVRISFNYNTVKDMYEEAKTSIEDDDEEYHQITIEEFLKEILNKLNDSKQTKKKSSKKE